MNLLIYGLCETTEYVVKMIAKQHNIIGYMDSFSNISSFRDKPFYKLESIRDIQFDYLIITIRNREISLHIMKELNNKYNIDNDKIIPFFVYANYQNYEIQLSKEAEDIEGIILGNSHATMGYLPEILDYRTVNLACSAQDILSVLHTFLKCKEEFYEKIKNIKYILIDMYDYNVFNIDNSLGNSYKVFLQAGGLQEERNWMADCSKTFEEKFFDTFKILINDKTKSEIMNQIFHEWFCDLEMEKNIAKNNWGHIKESEPLATAHILSSAVSKKREDTIKMNTEAMAQLLKEIKCIDEDIKIILTLIPRYETMEKVMAGYMGSWKEMFESLMEKYKAEYDITFLNYKTCESLFSNCRFYRDICHLNTVGAQSLTTILNKDLKSILNR